MHPAKASAPIAVPLTEASKPGAWDTFIADVSVSTSRTDSSVRRFGNMPVAAYRLEVSPQASGAMKTVMIVDRTPLNAAMRRSKARLGKDEVARIEFDGDGTAPRLLNADGEEIRHAAPPALPANWRLPADFQPGRPATARTVTAPRNVNAVPNWIDRFVVLPTASSARKASLTRALSKFGLTSRANEYSLNHDSVTQVIHVDPTLQVVTEIRQVVRGLVRRRMAIEYEKQGDGSAVQRRIIRQDLEPSGETRTTTTEFRNVRLEKRS